MCQVILAVSENKIRVGHRVVAVRRPRFRGHGNARHPLDRRYGLFGSREAHETPIEASSQRRSTGGVSRAGSVVTKPVLPDPQSRQSLLSAALKFAICIGH